ncbi:hypothetical protein DLM46_35535 [Paraburkholderia lacunae]|uniref:FUSC family protein n=1 Tax=Paraburkholderia lacunae TaxID=2211104 RepID=A0A370MX82_9BURK|nr:FUSC family protein [Paraburkholderia lacunae]RDJ97965.1 hypothetical protein DLM46_35535 [Paraburkholderia lacunae]
MLHIHHVFVAPSYISDTQTGIAIVNAACNWASTSGVTGLYVFKTILAALLALGVAMKLELPMPRTAMTTVFVLMQPQSGMVLAKSLYRICGTIVGLLATLGLISLFGQAPELFLGATALCIGICTAGAARNRNFRTYGFVLAGYTAALIGIPSTRVTEVTIGILSSGAVSALASFVNDAIAVSCPCRWRRSRSNCSCHRRRADCANTCWTTCAGIVFACTDSAATLRTRFESRTRDLMYQVRSISRDDPRWRTASPSNGFCPSSRSAQPSWT